MNTQPTFQTTAQQWLFEKSHTLAATSYGIYEGIFERYLYPAIGDYPVGSLTRKEIDRIVREIAERYAKEASNGQAEHTWQEEQAEGLRQSEGSGQTEGLGQTERAANEKGAQLKGRSLQMIRRLIKSVVRFYEEEEERASLEAENGEADEEAGGAEPLTVEELRQVLFCARNHRSPEMLAVLLILYCGIRRGEVCALSCDDIDMKKREIYIHRAVYRVRKKETGGSGKKTLVEIAELNVKKQIRTVEIPEELMDYVREFYCAGACLLTGQREIPMDTRTIKNRVDRIFEAGMIEGISFRQLHKTFASGKSDRKLLRQIFPVKGGVLVEKAINPEELLGRMAVSLAEIRTVAGMSARDVSELLDIPVSAYEKIEAGKEELSWVQYLALLWVFQNNDAGRKLIESKVGLPEELFHLS